VFSYCNTFRPLVHQHESVAYREIRRIVHLNFFLVQVMVLSRDGLIRGKTQTEERCTTVVGGWLVVGLEKLQYFRRCRFRLNSSSWYNEGFG